MNIHYKEIFKGTFASVSLKAIGAVFQFFLTVVVARKLGAADTGIFFLALTIVTVLSVVSRFGTDNYLVKVISFHNAKGSQEVGFAYLKIILLGISCISLLISTLLYISAPIVSEYFFNSAELGSVLKSMSIVVLLLSITLAMSFSLQGFKKIAQAVSIQNLIIPLISVLVFLLVVGSLGTSAPVYAYYSALIAAFIYAVYALNNVLREHSSDVRVGAVKWASIWSESKPYYFVSIFNQIVAWVPLFIVGAFVADEALGIYQASLRTTLLISFVLLASNSVVGPKISEFYADNDLGLLRNTVEGFTFILLAAAMPIIMVFLIYAENLMGIFGGEFTQGGGILRILVLGQLVNVYFGPVMLTLIMTSHADAARKILMWTSILIVLLCVFLIPSYGVLGAAWASTSAMVFQNIMAGFMVKKYLGYFPTPEPSLAFGALRYLSIRKS